MGTIKSWAHRALRLVTHPIDYATAGLNLNEYGIESEVTAPQSQNFAFLGHKSAKISFTFIRFYLPGAWRDYRLAFWGRGPNDMLAPLSSLLWGPWPDWPPTGSTSCLT